LARCHLFDTQQHRIDRGAAQLTIVAKPRGDIVEKRVGTKGAVQQ
jgi:hypothetical protein